MKQTRITSKDNLLDEHGRVKHPGYATSLVLDYDRSQVKAKKSRIKEWDYYFFGNDRYGVALTIADNSYMGLIGATFFDFAHKKKYDFKSIIPFTNGKLKMPNDSMKGDIVYQSKKITFKTILKENSREIYVKIPKFKGGKSFEFSANVDYLNQDSMVIITPYLDDEHAFYYNQKINNLAATGTLKFGKDIYQFDKAQGVLDWGRGVWTRDNTWYWSSMSTMLDNGEAFGFNLGYGFGDTSAASENMAFYKGKAYKLNDVDFGLPQNNFTDDWHFKSEDGAIDMIFTPLYDNRTLINLLLIKQDAHQVFGYFTGAIRISKDEVVTVKKAFGFAEKVRNVW